MGLAKGQANTFQLVLAVGGGGSCVDHWVYQLVLFPYMGVGIYMSFFTLVADVAVISTLILLGGAIWDLTKKRKGRLQKDLRHG